MSKIEDYRLIIGKFPITQVISTQITCCLALFDVILLLLITPLTI